MRPLPWSHPVVFAPPLTQVQLAERCGFPQARISELERGGRTPNLVTILRLSVALEYKPTDLVVVFNREDVGRLLPRS